MAQVSSSTWNAFIEVNKLFEGGKIKGQKFSPGDVVKGTLALKQWHMKPMLSLPDETKRFLLNKVKTLGCNNLACNLYFTSIFIIIISLNTASGWLAGVFLN